MIRSSFREIYIFIFSFPLFRRLNDRILGFALNVRGYDNHRSFKESGENFFIKKVLLPTNPAVCVDVGANVGSYTKVLLDETSAFVYSFEPLPEPFERLKKVAEEFPNRVKVVNKGVGEKNDTLKIHFNSSVPAHASFSEEVKNVSYVTNKETLDVDVIKLDDYFDNENISAIDFIKIDTEGYEVEVLMGALRTIKKFKPKFIQIEFNWHQLFRLQSLFSFSEILSEYSVFQLVRGGWIERDPKHPYSNFFMFSNFIFVRRA